MFHLLIMLIDTTLKAKSTLVSGTDEKEQRLAIEL